MLIQPPLWGSMHLGRGLKFFSFRGGWGSLDFCCLLLAIGMRFVVSLGKCLRMWLISCAQLIPLHFDVELQLLFAVLPLRLVHSLGSSFPIDYTCCSSCICAGFDTYWCITWFNSFLRRIVIIFEMSWNQQVLRLYFIIF